MMSVYQGAEPRNKIYYCNISQLKDGGLTGVCVCGMCMCVVCACVCGMCMCVWYVHVCVVCACVCGMCICVWYVHVGCVHACVAILTCMAAFLQES